ncbi:hypothetical protein NSK_005815 [Nannochloropsis salina CCMP1776]|uniref:Trafficking protein particle complex subunit n=1 Tax=Nannochloropsis salina CCMP1776 TaxID=1027361 RepID=A0A4D9CUE9_9STRA|nr:hypothetical protein NSK_005815 [Nannochloropsis salina CCMP1776]|eukprot:TFJ82862.1 hypothetical protein NSK_005815 [Nannochloropsis salina CCMP1776]
MSLFVIVGKNEPIFEADFSTSSTSTGASPNKVSAAEEGNAQLNQFILHSSLDMMEKAMWSSPYMNLRAIDRFNGHIVHAFLTAGGTAFLLLHDGSRGEESLVGFFKDVYELYVKLLMNPFCEMDRPIVSTSFEARVRVLEKRWLR